MQPGVGPGAKRKNREKEAKKKKIQRPGDFTAMILFSSLSMSTFSDWMNENFKSTKQPNTFSYPISNLAWSQPKGRGYQGKFDETIFVDCSSDIASLYESGGDGEQGLLVCLSFAISRLKEAMDRRTKDGLSGTVHCTICAYHPVEKLLFALSELLNNSLAYSSVYSSFVGYIKGIEEFRLAFRAIQKDKWKMVVDYCGVFDPYQAIANDKKGDAQRAEEMAEILKGLPPSRMTYSIMHASNADPTRGDTQDLFWNYDNDCEEWAAGDTTHRIIEKGERYIIYEGKKYQAEKFEEEYKHLVDPPVEEMNDNLRKMIVSYEKEKQRTDNRKKAANKAIKNRESTWKQQESIAERDAQYISSYSNRDAEGVSIMLNTLGLGPTNHKEKSKNAGMAPDKKKEIDKQIDDHNYQHALIPFEGKNMTPQQLEDLTKELDKKNQEGLQQIAEYKKAIDSKIAAERERVISERVLGVQILIAVGSLLCPPLALLDISITICEWLRKPNPSGLDTGMGIAGIAFDIIGLIPFFGKPLKLLGKSMSSAEMFDAMKLVEQSKHLQQIQQIQQTAKFQNLMSIDPAVQWSKAAEAMEVADDLALQAKLNNMMSIDPAVQFSKAAEAMEVADDLALQAKLNSMMSIDPAAQFSIAAEAASAADEAIPALANELTKSIEIEGEISLKSFFVSGASDTLDFIKSKLAWNSLFDFKNARLESAANAWVVSIGIGWNGIAWLRGDDSPIETPMTPEEKAMRQQQVDAALEKLAAEQEVIAAREALRNATTDAEREKAQNDLKQAERRQKEAQGFYDMRYNPDEPEAPSNSIDAEAELKRAQQDKKDAENAYKNAKNVEEKEAALKALDNAEKREQAAQNAVNANFVADALSSIDTSGAASALQNWENEYDDLEAVKNRHSVIQNNPNMIAALDYANGLDDTTPLQAMYNAEAIKALNDQYNSANLANQLSGDTQYGYDLALAQSNESDAFDEAVSEGDKYAEVWAAQVNADIAAQELKWTLESIDNDSDDNK